MCQDRAYWWQHCTRAHQPKCESQHPHLPADLVGRIPSFPRALVSSTVNAHRRSRRTFPKRFLGGCNDSVHIWCSVQSRCCIRVSCCYHDYISAHLPPISASRLCRYPQGPLRVRCSKKWLRVIARNPEPELSFPSLSPRPASKRQKWEETTPPHCLYPHSLVTHSEADGGSKCF